MAKKSTTTDRRTARIRRAIKARARAAFYQDADDWKQMIWSRGLDTQAIALDRLSR